MTTRLVEEATVTQAPNTLAWVTARMEAHASRSHRTPRCTGRSSDALCLFALGAGPRPTTCGTPTTGGRPDHPGGIWRGNECDHDAPLDVSDLAACERTWLMAPDAERAVMLPVLIEFQRYVLDGLNRYGVPVQPPADLARWDVATL